MSDNPHEEIDFTSNQHPRKLEYPQTLDTQKKRDLDHKKSFFEAKIISNENFNPSDSPILASSGDDIHFIFTIPKTSFFELDSNSIQREFIQLRNRSSNESVINKNSDFSHYDIECFDMLKVANLDKIINNLDQDNSREIINSYNEDYKNQLECYDKQLSGIIGDKNSDSNLMDTKNCMEEDSEDNRNYFIAVKEHYLNSPKDISEDTISAISISSKIENSEVYYERGETENVLKIKGAEFFQNLKCNKTRRIGDEFLEASTFNPKYASECVKSSHLESSRYQQVESNGINFERLEDSLPIDETCYVKISEISNWKNGLLNTDNSTEILISHGCVKHAEKMLVRNNHSNCSSLDYDDSSSIIPSTSTIFLISSGEPTVYSMKSIDSQVKSLNGAENSLEESLKYDFPNQAAIKSSPKYYLNDCDKNPRSSVLKIGDEFALKEPDVDDTGNKFLTYTPEDTFRKQLINNMEMLSNEDISLISSANEEQAEQKTSATVFIENKDINKAKATTYEKNNIESSSSILQKDEKLSFYILTPSEKEKVRSFTGCSEILAKRLVEEDVPRRNLRSNAVQRIFETRDKKSNLSEMFFTKSTDVDIVDEMEKESNKKTSTLLNDIKSDNDSDFDEYKTNINKFLKNEDEIDCAPTRVRGLEPKIPFIESEESIFSKNEKFSNSVIVSSSKPFNRIPILRRSFRSRSLESISFPSTKTPDKLTTGREENDSAENKKKRLSFSGIMNKKDIKSAVVNSTWEITKAIISPEASAISKKRANSEVIRSSQTLSRSKLRASMDFVKKHTKRASKVKK